VEDHCISYPRDPGATLREGNQNFIAWILFEIMAQYLTAPKSTAELTEGLFIGAVCEGW
jgi:hypothetical protein